MRVPTLVTTAKARSLRDLPAERIVVGDLDDLEREAKAEHVHLVVANSHAASIAERLSAPLLRVGIPQHDVIGAHAKAWIGYQGSRQALFLRRDSSEARPPRDEALHVHLPASRPGDPRRPQRHRHRPPHRRRNPRMIRVAFASDDVRTVNLHFGAAEQFVLYDIRPGIGELVGVGRFVKARMKGANAERGPDELPPPPDAEDRMTEDKVKAKIDFLRVRSCAGVYAAKVGVSSIRRLLEAGIQPVMVNKGFSIEELLNEVSLAMACGGISLGRARHVPPSSDRHRPGRRPARFRPNRTSRAHYVDRRFRLRFLRSLPRMSAMASPTVPSPVLPRPRGSRSDAHVHLSTQKKLYDFTYCDTGECRVSVLPFLHDISTILTQDGDLHEALASLLQLMEQRMNIVRGMVTLCDGSRARSPSIRALG